MPASDRALELPWPYACDAPRLCRDFAVRDFGIQRMALTLSWLMI